MGARPHFAGGQGWVELPGAPRARPGAGGQRTSRGRGPHARTGRLPGRGLGGVGVPVRRTKRRRRARLLRAAPPAPAARARRPSTRARARARTTVRNGGWRRRRGGGGKRRSLQCQDRGFMVAPLALLLLLFSRPSTWGKPRWRRRDQFN